MHLAESLKAKIGCGAPEPSLLIPEKIAVERWIAAGLFVLSCAYLLAFRRYVTMDPDEGIVLQGAERILNGEILYRDFFSFFTPGSYCWQAALLKLFGNSLIVARTALVLYGGLFTVFTYFIARRTSPRWIALTAAYLATIACLPWRFMVLHNWDSTVSFCLAVYFAVRFVEAPRLRWAVAVGTFSSLTFLFEQSKGAGLILGLLLGFCLLAWLKLKTPQPLWTIPNIFGLAAGFAWPAILAVTYFAAHHAVSAFLADIAWPLHHYAPANEVPYGWADWSDQTRQALFHSGDPIQAVVAFVAVIPCFIFPALPLIACFLLISTVIAAGCFQIPADRASHYCVVGSTVAGALFSILIVRPNIVHFVYLAPLLFVSLGWLMDGRDVFPLMQRSIRPLAVAIVLVTFTCAGMALLIANQDSRSILETRRGLVRTPGPDELLPYLQAHVLPSEKIFVYPYFPLAYFLADTANPTRYEYLQPGLHTREQDLEAIRELEAARTRVVLFEPSFYDKVATSWPNTPLSTFAADPVADFILRKYHPCANLASGNASISAGGSTRFSFMMRDGVPCPPENQTAQARN